MNYSEGQVRLKQLREQLDQVRVEMRRVRGELEPQRVQDYLFQTSAGERRLSELFGSKEHLFVVHNMGSTCPYCTVWADGYNGIYHHLASRAAFVVSSPEPPAAQRELAALRGWRFPMISHAGTTFAADMGYRSPAGHWLPGISVFTRNAGQLLRVNDTQCDTGDDFCALWHILDLLPHGPGDWQPKLSYDTEDARSAGAPHCCRR